MSACGPTMAGRRDGFFDKLICEAEAPGLGWRVGVPLQTKSVLRASAELMSTRNGRLEWIRQHRNSSAIASQSP